MPKLLSEIGEFVWSVVNNWAGYVTGGILIAFLWLWLALRQENVTREVASRLAVAFLVVATFNAWRQKSEALSELQKRLATPNLEGTIGSVWSGSFGARPLLIITLFFKNPLGPPSGIIGYQLSVKLNDGKTVLGEIPVMPTDEVRVSAGNNRFVLFKKAKFMPDQTQTPLPPGGSVDGWIWATFNGLKNEDLDHSTVILTFHDTVSNSAFTIKEPYAPTGGITLPGYGTRVNQ
jgi:hypothetical protein